MVLFPSDSVATSSVRFVVVWSLVTSMMLCPSMIRLCSSVRFVVVQSPVTGIMLCPQHAWFPASRSGAECGEW